MQNIESLEKLKADKAVLAIIFFKNVKTGETKIMSIQDPMTLAPETAKIKAEELGPDWSWIVYHRFANVDGFGSFEQSSNYRVL